MATTSPSLLMTYPDTGESGVAGFNDWGDLANSNFDFLEDALVGGATLPLTGAIYTLTDDEARQAYLLATGVLANNVAIVVPNRRKAYLVRNATTNPLWTVTVKTSAGTGVVVNQGSTALVYCDGTNVVGIVLAPVGTIVGTTDTQTLTNKLLSDSTVKFADNSDPTKLFSLQLSGITAATERTVTVKDASGTMMLEDPLINAIAALDLTGSTGGQFIQITGVDTVAVAEIIGTVAHTGGSVSTSSTYTPGVPSGDLLETGASADGHWIKYADGTMICWTTDGATRQSSTGTGSLFSSSSTTTWTFPQAFIIPPVVTGQAKGSGRWLGIDAPTTIDVAFQHFSATSQSGSLGTHLMAIGRWR